VLVARSDTFYATFATYIASLLFSYLKWILSQKGANMPSHTEEEREKNRRKKKKKSKKRSSHKEKPKKVMKSSK